MDVPAGGGFPEGRIGIWAYNSFSTGALPMSLDRVTLSMASGLAGSTGFSLDLMSDAGGVPGASLIALAGNSAPVSSGLYDYAPAGSFTLQAATTYWLHARIVPEGSPTATDLRSFGISATSDISEAGLPGWSIADQSRRDEVTLDSFGPSPGIPLQFAVNATLVPEPGTAVLAIFACGLMWALRRRFK